MSPFRSLIPPQPRVYSRNQAFLPSRAPRSANISSILSALRILPVATGVWGAHFQFSTLCLCASVANPVPKSCRVTLLQTLRRSLRSFPRSDRLFSIACGLFLQNTRGGVPLRELVRCTEAQKCLSVSPLLATLTQTPGRGVPPLRLISSDFSRQLVYPERSSRRATRLPRAFVARAVRLPKSARREGSLPFAHAGQFPPQASSVQPPETPRLCGPILFAQPLVSSLKPPEPDAKMTACSHHGDTKLPHCGQSMSEPSVT